MFIQVIKLNIVNTDITIVTKMNRIQTYIESYITFVFYKHRSRNKYTDLDAYLENEFKYVACNWDNEYNFVQWLGSIKDKLLTPTTVCTMIRTIQAYYGDDPIIKNVYLELTPKLTLLHYCYCIVQQMTAEKMKELVE